MAIAVPHLMFPPQIDGSGHLAAVEQNSDEDILACVYIALKTPLGSRLYVPNFGVNDYTFHQDPLPLPQLVGEVQASEPRAVVDLE
jgi:phage baseplate assembly protein W